MAGPMLCDLCESEPAQYLIGNTSTGEQTAVGAGCLIAWCLAQLTTRLEGEQLQAVATELYKSSLPPDQPQEAPARGGRKRKGSPPPEDAQPEQPAEEVEAQTAAGDG